jgi:sugar lactone lactonase YvrE
VKPTLLAFAAAAVALPTAGAPAESAAAKAPLGLRLLSGPPAHPVAGSPWRLVLRVRHGARPYHGPPPVLRGSGDVALIARTARTTRPGVFSAVVRFPTSGPWTLDVRVGGRRFPLGAFRVDVPVTQLIRDPFGIAATGDGSLIIAQRNGPLLRAAPDRSVSIFAPIEGVTSVSVLADGTVLASDAQRVHRLRPDGSAAMPPVVIGVESAVDGDGAGNIYAAVYENRVLRVDPAGTVSPFAGTGVEGLAGDGGPATAAQLFHPHSLAIGADGAVYIADTQNQRIRRVDPSTGVITTYATLGGSPIAVTAAPDGAVYSVTAAPGAVWRTTASGSSLIAQGDGNGIAVGSDGTVYLNQWGQKRISRIDPRSGLIRTILRGPGS